MRYFTSILRTRVVAHDTWWKGSHRARGFQRYSKVASSGPAIGFRFRDHEEALLKPGMLAQLFKCPFQLLLGLEVSLMLSE